MNKLICKKCGKEVEGYNPNHVNFLMKQHELSHGKVELNGEGKTSPDAYNSKDDSQQEKPNQEAEITSLSADADSKEEGK